MEMMNTIVLTVIDVFSKRAWVFPLKNKTSNSIVLAFKSLLNEVIPIKIQTDNGKEFVNSSFKDLMNEYDINHFTTNNEIKCSVIEQFNRTLKNKMFKHFTSSGKRRYIDVLKKLIYSYNNSYHRSIKMKPSDVIENNQNIVFKNIYGVINKRELLRKMKSPKLSRNDNVRVKYQLGPLDRGYYPNWSDATYKINKNMKNINKPLYTITDSNDQVLKRRFYPEEIQKIKNNNIFRVEKIIKQVC